MTEFKAETDQTAQSVTKLTSAQTTVLKTYLKETFGLNFSNGKTTLIIADDQAVSFSSDHQWLIEEAAILSQHIENAKAEGDWKLAAMAQRTLDDLINSPDTITDRPL